MGNVIDFIEYKRKREMQRIKKVREDQRREWGAAHAAWGWPTYREYAPHAERRLVEAHTAIERAAWNSGTKPPNDHGERI